MSNVAQVAVKSPVYRVFDYRWPFQQDPLPGIRVTVPFGRQRLLGLVVGSAASTKLPDEKLRRVLQVHDDVPILPEGLLQLLSWASRYYQHPLGEVLASALPVLLRRGHQAALSESRYYRWLPNQADAVVPRSAHIQQQLIELLRAHEGRPVSEDQLRGISNQWRQSMKPLLKRGWVVCDTSIEVPRNQAHEIGPELSTEQADAVKAIVKRLRQFSPFLLRGVTGSGKTEVYLRCIAKVQQMGLQSLILVPEISLTPQLMRRFERRIDGCLVSLHSRLNERERLQSWLCAAHGHADVVIGTRSSILAPLPNLGLIIIDEEHDTSLKQQDGFRYHARDMALMRARDCGCPVVLGSATPSFETLNNVKAGRFTELCLSQRAGEATPPSLSLLDIRRRKLVDGMSDRLLDAIARHISEDGQALVFINRRGFAPTLLCHDCGAVSNCKRCDAHMTVHAQSQRLRCHYCGAERALPVSCEDCGSTELERVGHGTERIAASLRQLFPEVRQARIDRDSTQRKGALEAQLALATSGQARILVGTQMLAKGHHFPHLTLVCILDADRGLYGSDFRSLEHMAQLIVQVAGRAGRESRRGEVLIQTHLPDNPMLQMLIHKGYAAFAQIALDDRRTAGLPPFSYMALVRAEASHASDAQTFLTQLAAVLRQDSGSQLEVMGPAPAPMEKMGGRFRAQLLLQSNQRVVLNERLASVCQRMDQLPGARRCRWSIDVDPVDLF